MNLPECFIRRHVLTVESEPIKSTVDELYSWASQLASESRNDSIFPARTAFPASDTRAVPPGPRRSAWSFGACGFSVLIGRDNGQPKLRDSVWGIRATQLDGFDSHRARHKHYPSPFVHPQAMVEGDFPVQIASGPRMQTSDHLSFFQLRYAGKRPCRRGRRSLSSQSGRDSVNSPSGLRTEIGVWMRSSLLLDHTSRSTRETGARVSDHIDSHCFWSEPPL